MTNKERSVEEITLQFAGLLDSLKARIYQAQSRSEPGVDSAMVKVINVFEETLQAERQKREDAEKRGYEKCVEDLAIYYYNGLDGGRTNPEWVPWTVGGNSQKQDEARRMAKHVLTKYNNPK